MATPPWHHPELEPVTVAQLPDTTVPTRFGGSDGGIGKRNNLARDLQIPLSQGIAKPVGLAFTALNFEIPLFADPVPPFLPLFWVAAGGLKRTPTDVCGN